MKPGELLRVRVAFGALGAVPVFLAGWLGWVQVAQGATLRSGSGEMALDAAAADSQAWKTERVPAPRGTIVDRHGRTLAADCESYEVRARITVPRSAEKDVDIFRGFVDQLVADFSLALVADPDLGDRAGVQELHRGKLRDSLRAAWGIDELPASGVVPARNRRPADILLHGRLDRLVTIDALHALAARKKYSDLVTLYFMHSFQRAYPDRDLTFGIVGHCSSAWVDRDDGRRELRRFGVCGLESFVALEPDEHAERRFLRDGRGNAYFVAPVEHPPIGKVLHTTLDLELQRAAVRELTEHCEAGIEAGDGKGRAKWGSLVLVDLDSGDVLAAASWQRDLKFAQAGSFTPYQNLFEPGSIVKPLVFAYALEVGVLDWNHEYDCFHRGRGTDYGTRIAPLGRAKPVNDDHDCLVPLAAHGILINSSNIGAAYVGLQLERTQWQDYMRAYGIGRSLGLNLPGESMGGTNARSFAADVTERSFRANSAISFSFGYELMATPMQIARAYRRLFKGLGAELRLVRGLDIGGEFHQLPAAKDNGPAYRPEVLGAVRAALVDVLGDDPKATGHRLRGIIRSETGIDVYGLVGGKTGTAVSSTGSGVMRNASFVGFLPADNPRYLAVCVMQKDNGGRFYGGKYAGPPAVKLLLQCQSLAERRQLRQEPQRGTGGQIRAGFATPGTSGWQSSAGAGITRDTR